MNYDDIHRHVTESAGFKRHAYTGLDEMLVLTEGVYFALTDEEFQRQAYFALSCFREGMGAETDGDLSQGSYDTKFGKIRILRTAESAIPATTILFPFEN